MSKEKLFVLESFRSSDTNKSNSLEFEEYERFLKKALPNENFNRYDSFRKFTQDDADRNDKITLDEVWFYENYV